MPKGSDAGTKASSRYQKLHQRDHILLRPDSYVGSIEKVTEKLWVVDKRGQFQNKEVRYVPALYKIFDEILVNAADNLQRDPRITFVTPNLLRMRICLAAPCRWLSSVFKDNLFIFLILMSFR